MTIKSQPRVCAVSMIASAGNPCTCTVSHLTPRTDASLRTSSKMRAAASAAAFSYSSTGKLKAAPSAPTLAIQGSLALMHVTPAARALARLKPAATALAAACRSIRHSLDHVRGNRWSLGWQLGHQGSVEPGLEKPIGASARAQGWHRSVRAPSQTSRIDGILVPIPLDQRLDVLRMTFPQADHARERRQARHQRDRRSVDPSSHGRCRRCGCGRGVQRRSSFFYQSPQHGARGAARAIYALAVDAKLSGREPAVSVDQGSKEFRLWNT